METREWGRGVASDPHLDNLQNIFLYSLTLAERQRPLSGVGAGPAGARFRETRGGYPRSRARRHSAGAASPSCGGIWEQMQKPAEYPRLARE